MWSLNNMIPFYKNKGNIADCGYLTSHTFKDLGKSNRQDTLENLNHLIKPLWFYCGSTLYGSDIHFRGTES